MAADDHVARAVLVDVAAVGDCDPEKGVFGSLDLFEEREGLARVDADDAAVLAVGVFVRRADRKVAHAVAIEVAQRGDCPADVAVGLLAEPLLDQLAVAAGVEIGGATALLRRDRKRCTHEDLGVAVAVDIGDRGNRATKLVGSLAVGKAVEVALVLRGERAAKDKRSRVEGGGQNGQC